MKKILILTMFALNLSGCASYFTRKNCEEMNWYNHGEQVALRGEWLDADKTVLECRKVEANISESKLDQGFKAGRDQYCTPQKSYQIGKSGDNFARSLCEGPSINSIMAQYTQGIRDYCSKVNAYSAGASGKRYQNVCPTNLEADFLPGYRKGRKKFIESQITIKESERLQQSQNLILKQSELNLKLSELNNMKSHLNYLEMQKNNALTAQNPTQAGYIDGQINSVTSNINSKQSEVNGVKHDVDSINKKQETLGREIADFRTELPSLDQ